MKAVSPYFDKATANEFNKGAVACFYKKYENCTMGKYVRKYRERMSSPSAISVQEPNVGEIFKGRQVVHEQHPLLAHQVEEWKNIPICVTEAMKEVISSIVEGNQGLYEFQISQNTRLSKVQK